MRVDRFNADNLRETNAVERVQIKGHLGDSITKDTKGEDMHYLGKWGTGKAG